MNIAIIDGQRRGFHDPGLNDDLHNENYDGLYIERCRIPIKTSLQSLRTAY